MLPISRRLLSIPSQVLQVKYGAARLDITLDSGATVSYLRLDKANELNLPILPNNQLAMLADKKTKISSVGEVDFLVTVDHIRLRVRALVMTNLQAECFGGTTFHVDNKIVPDIAKGTICIHGKFVINQFNNDSNLPLFPPPSEITASTDLASEDNLQKQTIVNAGEMYSDKSYKFNAISLPSSKVIYPGDTLNIPIPKSAPQSGYVSISPSFSDAYDNKLWQPQICEIINGNALFKNLSVSPLLPPNHCHFRPHPVSIATLTELKSKESDRQSFFLTCNND